MVFNPLGFALGTVLADREGVADPQSRARLGLVSGIIGSPVAGIAVATVLARNEVAAAAPANGAPASGLVEVPNVKGKSVAEAQKTLQSLGLRMQQRDAHSTTTRKGTVITQDPEAGTPVPEDSTVAVTISQGFLLTDVTNISFADAEAQLESLGLQVDRKDEISTTVSEGFVITQDPKADTSVSTGDIVTLTVSRGSNVEVPDVTGKRFADAEKLLRELGFDVKREDKSSDAVNPDFVITQDPKAGESRPQGSQVKLAVSEGAGISVPDVTNKLFADAKAQLEDLELKVDRVDETSDAVRQDFVIKQDKPAGDTVPLNSTVTLTVSQGSSQHELVDLPDLVGQKYRKAREALQDLDFEVKREDVDSDKPKNEVVRHDPGPGEIARESLVTLFVSKGPSSPG